MTGDLQKASLGVRTRIEKSRFARALLKTVGVLAVYDFSPIPKASSLHELEVVTEQGQAC